MPVGDQVIEEAIARFALQLESEILHILTTDFSLEPIEHVCLSQTTIYDISKSSCGAMEDLRNHYPNSISLIKYLSTVMFWIIKLKPVSPDALLKDGDLVSVRDINEQVALYWGIIKLLESIREGALPELIRPSKKNSRRFSRVVKSYITQNMYRSSESGAYIEGTQKYRETVYYLRFKKITAINIYEIFMHMIVVYRSFESRFFSK